MTPACPLRYRYGAAAIAQAPEYAAQTLYVIGGLYGNRPALEAIEAMAQTETGPVKLCFNGDFNWFNIDDEGFREINQRVLRHSAILGNVEAELGEASDEAGCGCAYPESVDPDIVRRSNQIHALLKRTASRHPELIKSLQGLPMSMRWRVGELRIGVVHGDAESLAGWRFDAACLDDPAEHAWRAECFAHAKVDVFASTHTCLPALRRFDSADKDAGERAIINNGAAGMPNFSHGQFGVLTRIAVQASPHPSLYGQTMHGVHIDALAVAYDHQHWLTDFLLNWPPGSPAWQSYFKRISEGPEYSLTQAFRLAHP